jgi:hypothetical protein
MLDLRLSHHPIKERTISFLSLSSLIQIKIFLTAHLQNHCFSTFLREKENEKTNDSEFNNSTLFLNSLAFDHFLNLNVNTNMMKMHYAEIIVTVLWDVMPCSLINVCRPFRGKYCLHLQCQRLRKTRLRVPVLDELMY